MSVRLHIVGSLVACLFCNGCLHTQLRRNAVDQAATLPEFYQHQVLDNLAMFVVDPNSLPFFALPADGLSQLEDRRSVSANWDWSRTMLGNFLFSDVGLDADHARSTRESWELTPVTDPRKLARMRCAYQYAVAVHRSDAVPSATCPSCVNLLDAFDGAGSSHITQECLQRLGECGKWFRTGGKSDVPKRRGCAYVGHHCGCYVWVVPGCRDKLAQLTMAIMDYALRDPAPAPTKTVQFFVDAQGLPVPEAEAVAKVHEVVAADASLPTLWFDEPQIQDILDWREKGYDLVGLGRQTRRLFDRTILSFEKDKLTNERIVDLLKRFDESDPLRIEAKFLLEQLQEIQESGELPMSTELGRPPNPTPKLPVAAPPIAPENLKGSYPSGLQLQNAIQRVQGF